MPPTFLATHAASVLMVLLLLSFLLHVPFVLCHASSHKSHRSHGELVVAMLLMLTSFENGMIDT